MSKKMQIVHYDLATGLKEQLELVVGDEDSVAEVINRLAFVDHCATSVYYAADTPVSRLMDAIEDVAEEMRDLNE